LTFKEYFSITVHILFNLTWNIHQDTPHSDLSNSTKFKRIKIIQSIISGHNTSDMNDRKTGPVQWHRPTIPDNWEAEIGGSQFEASPRNSVRLYLKNKLKAQGLLLWHKWWST
jgi:hypothetical protein